MAYSLILIQPPREYERGAVYMLFFLRFPDYGFGPFFLIFICLFWFPFDPVLHIVPLFILDY
jgi:hypothetical protein